MSTVIELPAALKLLVVTSGVGLRFVLALKEGYVCNSVCLLYRSVLLTEIRFE